MNTRSRIIKPLGLLCTILLLSSCGMVYETRYIGYDTYRYGEMPYYQMNYSGGMGYYADYQDAKSVVVPDTYHVGPSRAPVSAKDGDMQWVSSQNPQAYTIEIVNDEKPAAVAGKLYQLPKTDHQAEVKYNQNGKSYYKGLYGSYSSKEEAEKALNALPDNIKKGAGVNSWSNIQNQVNQ